MITVGIIGTGIAGDKLVAPALARLDNVELWSFLSRSRPRAEELARKHGAVGAQPGHDNLDSMLADQRLDAVVICNEDGSHGATAIAAARAGKHVFVEKPLALRSDEARKVVDACQKAGVRLAVGYRLRFQLGHLEMARRLQAGRYGNVSRIDIRWGITDTVPGWRLEAGKGRWWVTSKIGTHALDLASWLCGWNSVEEIRLAAMLSPKPGVSADATMDVLISSKERTCVANIMCTLTHDETSVVRVRTDRGESIEAVNSVNVAGLHTVQFPNEALISYPNNSQFRDEMANFVEAIETGQSPRADGMVGVLNVDLMEAVDSAAGLRGLSSVR